MSVLYIFLTLLMFLDCVILVLLVLLQLPKKEAGAGLAFGGGATDALFGAGSGNVLTKITKYAAGIFFCLAILMAMVASHHGKSGFEQEQESLGKSAAPANSQGTAPMKSPSGSTEMPLLSNLPPVQSLAAPATNQTAPATNKTAPATGK